VYYPFGGWIISVDSLELLEFAVCYDSYCTLRFEIIVKYDEVAKR
jgi:hypothetical protein